MDVDPLPYYLLRHDYLNEHLKNFCYGTNPDDFPKVVSSVPVSLNYEGTEFPFEFHAGFTAVGSQNEVDGGMLFPELGWYVTHVSDPPQGNNHDSMMMTDYYDDD